MDELKLSKVLTLNKRDAAADGAEECDVEYGHCVKVAPRGCRALQVELRDRTVLFPYSLLVDGEWTPTGFWVEFEKPRRQRVVVEGRNLRGLFERIGDHTVRSLRALDRDFEDGPDPVVTALRVEPAAG